MIGGCLALLLLTMAAIGLGARLAGVSLSFETDPHRWRVRWAEEVGVVLESDDGQDRYVHGGKAWEFGPVRLYVSTRP